MDAVLNAVERFKNLAEEQTRCVRNAFSFAEPFRDKNMEVVRLLGSIETKLSFMRMIQLPSEKRCFAMQLEVFRGTELTSKEAHDSDFQIFSGTIDDDGTSIPCSIRIPSNGRLSDLEVKLISISLSQVAYYAFIIIRIF